MTTTPIDSRQETLFDPLREESFDTTFPFLKAGFGMEYYYASTPEPGHEDAMPRRSVRSHVTSQDTSVPTNDSQEDVSMGHTEGDMSHLTLSGHATSFLNKDDQALHQDLSPFPYPQYAMHLQEAPANPHPAHYHPYRAFGPLRSPRFGRPLSPPISLSPPGSSSSHPHLALSHSPPTAMSPTVVSPASAIESTLSDNSPPGAPWSYPLPHGTPSNPHRVYTGYPLDTISSLPAGSPPNQTSRGLSMITGFPYPVVTPPQRGGRSMRPRPTRQSTSVTTPSVKKERKEDDNGSSSDETGPRDGNGGSLGFSPAANDNDRMSLPVKREDMRKARIESEQRRRDELREGFKRLKEALPASNQRSSKSSLLDRAVAHVQQIQSANHYLLHQNEQYVQELASLRQSNGELVRAMTQKQGPGSSPEPAGRT